MYTCLCFQEIQNNPLSVVFEKFILNVLVCLFFDSIYYFDCCSCKLTLEKFTFSKVPQTIIFTGIIGILLLKLYPPVRYGGLKVQALARPYPTGRTCLRTFRFAVRARFVLSGVVMFCVYSVKCSFDSPFHVYFYLLLANENNLTYNVSIKIELINLLW